MAKSNSIHEIKIEGIKYTIKNFNFGPGKNYSEISSSISKKNLIFYSIEYSEETKTFQVTDYIKVRQRRVKIMLNLNLYLNFVGLVYNDLDGFYDTIVYEENCIEDPDCDTETIYEEYIKRLKKRLSQNIDNRETKFREDNRKVLTYRIKNND